MTPTQRFILGMVLLTFSMAMAVLAIWCFYNGYGMHGKTNGMAGDVCAGITSAAFAAGAGAVAVAYFLRNK